MINRPRRRTLVRVLSVGLLLSALLVSAGQSSASAKAPRTTILGKGKCGGIRIPKPGHGWWVCTFDDEFNATTLATTQWIPSITVGTDFTSGPADNRVCYFNSKNNISESGGYLSLTVRKEYKPFDCGGLFTTQYSGGSVSTVGKFSQAYGRFEVRAQFPAVTVAGLQETLWLYPVAANYYGPRPISGEIDFAEAYSFLSQADIPYVHYVPAGTDPNVSTQNCPTLDPTIFHTYTLVWSPTTLAISVDGTQCLVDAWHPHAPLSGSQPFDQPFFMVLTQALGINANAFDPATTPLPATTLIDYARIWR
jgi:beta-glucanase (GH16 family)